MLALSRLLERVVAAAVRRPVVVVAGTVLLAVGGGLLALGLRPSAGTDTLVDRTSASFRATDDLHQSFGDDAVLILVREDLGRLMLSSDLGRLLALEGCISGNIPAGARPPAGPKGPCAALGRDKPIRVVYGPGTFAHQASQEIAKEFLAKQRQEAAREKRAAGAARGLAKARGMSRKAQERLAEQARTLVRAEFVRNTLRLALAYGIRDVPRIDDPRFVSQLVFDPSRGATTPKARFSYILPNSRSALIQVRMRPELTDAERGRTIELIREATRLPEFRLKFGGTYTVTGAPVVVADVTRAISRAIVSMLVAALLVMAATLLLVFRSRPRLLPLGIALAAAGVVFGGMALVGASLTMASIAVLPILVGLAVDYAIQLQSRFDEVESADRLPAARAAPRAAAVGGPVIAVACAATAAGFLVLSLSPVPMVRGFGGLLVIGVLVAFAIAVTGGFAVLALVRDSRTRPRGRARRPAVAAAREQLRAAWLGAGGILSACGRGALELLPRPVRNAAGAAQAGVRAVPGRVSAAWRRALAEATTRPVRVVGIGAAVAAVGLVADTQTRVVSDIPRLVPADLPALRDLHTLQRNTGVSGQIDVIVSARDLTHPRVMRWMISYQKGLLRRYRHSPERGCGRAELCPALSLPDLFRPSRISDQSKIRALLNAVPPYFSQAVITSDRKRATMAFGIKLMPLDRQQDVIETMRERLHPPPGVTARLAGLPVLAAEANAKVSSDWRRLFTVAASLVMVALVLMFAYRQVDRALVPLVPIALAAGWSALVLFLIRVPLNPMSVTLGVLVIAISTEFSVLLAHRYHQEREAGHPPSDALARTYASTGKAVLASGITAIAGFGVLVFSSIRMLRDFGAVTVVDLSVSLLGVMVVLPAVLVLDERGELHQLPGRAVRAVRMWLAGLRGVRVRRPALRRPRLRRPALRMPRLRRPRVTLRRMRRARRAEEARRPAA
jgi:hydrophobe/amphiphile efflux-3 (HAE3) family protein